MAISIQASVGELVVQQPGRARVFEQAGIDYCFQGGQSLAAACRAAGLEVQQVCSELEVSDQLPCLLEEDWSAAPLSRLIDHLVTIHHDYLRSALRRLERLMTQAAIHHGLRYRRLADLAETFLEMRSELVDHLEREERALFPLIRRLETGEAAPDSVNHSLAVMEGEHRHIGEALKQMRRLTEGYAAPADGCAAYQSLMSGLAELEDDLRQHFHKENNILFPRAERLEREVAEFV